MRNTSHLPSVCESRRLGRILGVPSGWLRDELKAGRLPGIDVNNSKALFSPRATMKALADRAKADHAEGNR